VEQLRTSETDMKNLFYREQEARQVLELDYRNLPLSATSTWSFALLPIVTS
jgi:hypothetical protein